MTRPGLPVALLRAGTLLLALASAVGAAHADGFLALDGKGALVNMLGHSLTSGSGVPNKLPVTGLTDAAGNDISGVNPLRVGPGIVAVTPVDRGGAITVANAAQAVMNANAGRKGGWVVADPNAQGTFYVSYTGTASTTGGAGNQCAMAAGSVCPLTINGFVIQTAVSIAGTVAGDAFEAVEFN